ncbi:MAG TPA: GH116 family glycosyl-hydrolase [bacterium]|nr:GH116 family glycosyl-hydrolase [bacterium]
MRKLINIVFLCFILLYPEQALSQFESEPERSNGVPLGGIGTGAVEILPDGRFANLSINNNRSESERIDFSRGSLFSIFIDNGEEKETRILQTKTELDISHISGNENNVLMPEGSIEYTGLYPKFKMHYSFYESPVDVNLTGFSPFIPGNLEYSTIPSTVFIYEIKNTSELETDVSVSFSWENLNGCFGNQLRDSRYKNKILTARSGSNISGIKFGYATKNNESYWGNYATLVDCPENGITSYSQWNPYSPEETSIFWDSFSDDGILSDSIKPVPGSFTGTIACRITVSPGEKKEIAFSLGWRFPDYYAGMPIEGKNMGNYYSRNWETAQTAALATLKHRDELLNEIDNWHKKILESSIPEWLKLMLINNLYVYSTNTLFDKDGRYSIMETPHGPMMGTLDQRFYSSITTLLFFPKLEDVEMNLFADTKNPNDEGRIYHDLGDLRFDNPKTGTTDKKWTDLNPKFVLMAYRNYLWTGNELQLRKLFPKLKSVMGFTFDQDEDGDLLPDQHGRSTTYDDWAFYGTNSYASGIYLAAMDAYIDICLLFDEIEEADKYSSILKKATENFEEKLWDEDNGYFILYNDEGLPDGEDKPVINKGSHDGQLAGQWYGDFLHTKKLFPQEKIDRSIGHIREVNQKEFGVAKGLMNDGTPVPNPESEEWWSESENGWPHYETCHYASLAVSNDFVDYGMESVKKVFDNVHKKYGLAWNQPLRWDLGKNGTYGWGADRYMTSPSIWHFLFALEGFSINAKEKVLRLLPRLPTGANEMKAPLRIPGSWGWMEYELSGENNEYYQILRIAFDQPLRIKKFIVNAPPENLIAGVKFNLPDESEPEFKFDRMKFGKFKELEINLKEFVEIGPKGIVIEIKGLPLNADGHLGSE